MNGKQYDWRHPLRKKIIAIIDAALNNTTRNTRSNETNNIRLHKLHHRYQPKFLPHKPQTNQN